MDTSFVVVVQLFSIANMESSLGTVDSHQDSFLLHLWWSSAMLDIRRPMPVLSGSIWYSISGTILVTISFSSFSIRSWTGSLTSTQHSLRHTASLYSSPQILIKNEETTKKISLWQKKQKKSVKKGWKISVTVGNLLVYETPIYHLISGQIQI